MRRRVGGMIGGMVVGVALLASGCSTSSVGSAKTLTTVISGQLTKTETVKGATFKGGSSTATTIPLAAATAQTALFTALSTFQGCLKGHGTSFIGIPGKGGPSNPANNPSYLHTLEVCAAQSNILQALKAAQTAQKHLTNTQIQMENKEYIAWRKCMISRGWGIPTPTPNKQGLLFSFGGTGSSGPQMKPPPGQNILSSPDLQQCLATAKKTVTGGHS